MRRFLIGLTASVALIALAAGAALASRPAQSWTFVAPLSGAAERPSPIDTQARGVAIFHLSADGQSISYKLIASNIENVTMAHIHCCAGSEGTAGVSVWLYPDAPPPSLIPGRHDGVLATGTITAADVVGGPPAAASDRIAALVEFIQAGQAYVNVHTTQNGPGEIRGQLD